MPAPALPFTDDDNACHMHMIQLPKPETICPDKRLSALLTQYLAATGLCGAALCLYMAGGRHGLPSPARL